MINQALPAIPRANFRRPALSKARFSREGAPFLAFSHLRSAGKPVTIREALDAYAEWLGVKGYSPWTVTCVRCAFSAFYRETKLGPATILSKVTEDIAEKVLHRFGTRYTPGTGWRYATLVMQVFKFFALGQLLLASPFGKIPLPEQPDRLPLPALNAEEVQLLLAAPNLRQPWGLRTRAFLEVLYSTGLRLGECIGIKLQDVDFHRGVIRVMGKGAKERLVPVGDEALRWIRRYLDEVRPRYAGSLQELWVGYTGRPMIRHCIQTAIRKTAVRAGIKKPVTAHTLRRTFATHLLRRGASVRVVQEILGHRTGQSIDRYIRLEPKELRDAHDSTHPRT
jgi:integrase/recombinase XerD